MPYLIVTNLSGHSQQKLPMTVIAQSNFDYQSDKIDNLNPQI